MFGACHRWHRWHRWHHQMCKLFSVVEILLTFKSSCIKCILLRIECLCFEQRLRLSASTKSGRKSKFIQLFFLFCKFFHQYTTKTISRTFTKNQEIVNSKWFFINGVYSTACANNIFPFISRKLSTKSFAI